MYVRVCVCCVRPARLCTLVMVRRGVTPLFSPSLPPSPPSHPPSLSPSPDTSSPPRITPHGAMVARLPLHPRLGHMVSYEEVIGGQR